MMRLEVLVEGAADTPVVREVLTRRFKLVEGLDFRIHPHKGKGKLPHDVLSPPEPHRQGLLDQLPAKLRGWSYLGDEACVVVLVDADDESCIDLLARLNALLARLHKRPKRVLFRLAIEETESWFIADTNAVKSAYPRAKTGKLRRISPDAVVGAWEMLANALGVPGSQVSGAAKYEWAESISPHLDLDYPRSPSMRKLISGLARELGTD